MSKGELLLTIDPLIEDEYTFRDFFRLIMKKRIEYEYNDENEMYYVYESDYMISRKRQQIGKFFKLCNNEIYHLKLFEYDIKYDYELLDFIEEKFSAINKYLKETRDYDVRIGIGRYIDTHTVQSFDFLSKWFELYNYEEIKRILAILSLIRKINFQDCLNDYDDILVLDKSLISCLYDIIYKNNMNMYHIMYLVEKYKSTLEKINIGFPIDLGVNIMFDGMSHNVLKQLTEFQYHHYFNELVRKELTTEVMREMLNYG